MKQNQSVSYDASLGISLMSQELWAVAHSKSLPSPVWPSCKEMCILGVESREQSLIHPLVSWHSHGLCRRCKGNCTEQVGARGLVYLFAVMLYHFLAPGPEKNPRSSPVPAFGCTQQWGAQQACQHCSGWSFAQHSHVDASYEGGNHKAGVKWDCPSLILIFQQVRVGP